MKEQIQLIAVSLLRASPDNCRAIVTKGANWESFAASIQESGIQIPLLVRECKDQAKGEFEIIAGHRRLQAARQLNLETVPCIVKACTDEETGEIRVIENLQRLDLTPLEEAAQVDVLVEQGYGAKAIALKIGKSLSWVLQRVKLAKIKPALAKKVADWNIASLLTLALFDELEQEMVFKRYSHYAGGPGAKEIGDYWFQCSRDLRKAAWKLDEDLAPQPCSKCSQRTGHNPDLFGSSLKEREDRCLNVGCWNKKVELKAAELAKAKPRPIVTTEYSEAPKSVAGQAVKRVFDAVTKQKKGYVEAISADTGKLVYVQKHDVEEAKKSDVAADGTKPKKNLKQKQAALDLRRWKELASEYAAQWEKHVTIDKLTDRFGSELNDVLLMMAQFFGVSNTARHQSTRKPMITEMNITTVIGKVTLMTLLDQMEVRYGFFNPINMLKPGKDNTVRIEELKCIQKIMGLDQEAEWARICKEIPDPKSWAKK